jgi:protein SCO1/2
MRRTASILAGVAILAGASWFAWQAHGHDHDGHAQLAMLDRSMLRVAATQPIAVPAHERADGKRFDAAALRGRWSLVFFGFTSCPDVCPTTLQTLASFARDPASGMEAGTTQVVFVTVDPATDTPRRISEWLAAFDRRFIGVTGAPDALERFTAAAGAGFAPKAGGSMDHSTSVFVVDPEGRLAGVLLHPASADSVRADLEALRG